jgi:hypothetical protein
MKTPKKRKKIGSGRNKLQFRLPFLKIYNNLKRKAEQKIEAESQHATISPMTACIKRRQIWEEISSPPFSGSEKECYSNNNEVGYTFCGISH